MDLTMTTKRFISILITIAMVLSLFSGMTVTAEEAEMTNYYEYMLEVIKPENNYGLPDKMDGGNVFFAWNWSFENIEANLEKIAEQGFGTVLVSPPNEIKLPTLGANVLEPAVEGVSPNGWWMLYEPAGFQINEFGDNALGTKADFVSMCDTAGDYGIRIMVDAVVGYMGSDDDHIGAYDNASTNPMDHVAPRAWEFEPEIMTANAFHNPWVWGIGKEQYGDGWTDYNIEEDLTQHAVDGRSDLATETQVVQDAIYDYLVELVEAGAEGFWFTDAKHIETQHDTYFASDFWDDTIGRLRANYPDKELYAVGGIPETLGDGRAPSEYTEYMDLTDLNAYWSIYNAVTGDSGDPLPVFDENSYIPHGNVVLQNESIDSYTGGITSALTVEQRNKIWALTASRKDMTGIYFARPDDTAASDKAEVDALLSGYTLGDAFETAWASDEVRAINQFANYFADASEKIYIQDGIAVIQRGQIGAVLVNLGGNGGTISLDAQDISLAQKKYTDSITGNEFVMEDGVLSVTIGDSGIAVLYCSELEKNLSAAEISLSGTYTYTGEAIEPTVEVTFLDKALESGTDYTVEYSNNVNAGTATVTVLGIGKYSGAKTAEFEIGKATVGDKTEEKYFHYTRKTLTIDLKELFTDVDFENADYSLVRAAEGITPYVDNAVLIIGIDESYTSEDAEGNPEINSVKAFISSPNHEDFLYKVHLHITEKTDVSDKLLCEAQDVTYSGHDNIPTASLADDFVPGDNGEWGYVILQDGYEETDAVDAGHYEVTVIYEDDTYYGEKDVEFDVFPAVLEQASPTVATVNKGDTLENATLSKGVFLGVDGEPLEGIFEWADGAKVITEDSVEKMWFFVGQNYKEVEFDVEVRCVDFENVIFVGNNQLEDGDYLTNDGEIQETKPSDGGYAYYKNDVLTLNNFVSEGEVGENSYIGFEEYYEIPPTSIYSPSNLEIRLLGESRVVNENNDYTIGIYCTGNLIIDGKGAVELVVENGGSGIFVQGDLAVKGGTVKIHAYDDGVEANGNINISGGELHFEVGYSGIEADGELEIDNADIYILSREKIETDMGIIAADGITLGKGVKISKPAGGKIGKNSVDEYSVVKKNGEVADEIEISKVSTSGNKGGSGSSSGGGFTVGGTPINPVPQPGIIPSAPETKGFEDIANHWAKADVEYVHNKGIMNGVSDNSFDPDGKVTRGMLVTVLYRLEGEPAVNRGIPFGDVDMGMYYANAIIWAQQNGIVKGITETEFAPDENITREQIAAIMQRYAIHKGMEAVTLAENLHFVDSNEISEYAVSAMNWAVGCGLINGKTENTVNPKDFATRAEIAVILHRFIEANGK